MIVYIVADSHLGPRGDIPMSDKDRLGTQTCCSAVRVSDNALLPATCHMQPEQTDAEFFGRLAARTAEELDLALACYYPVEGNNDLPEAMTATYLAFQLRDAGFRVFPQVQCSGRIDNHLDFAAVNPASRTVVLAEAKKLYSSEKARSLGRDWRRLQAASIVSDLRHIPAEYRRFACLLATTWNEAYREWWADPDRPPAPPRQRNPDDWADLGHALGGATTNHAINVPLARLGWGSRLYVLFSFVPLI